MDETLKLLVEFVRTASPVIWEAVYRQVYVQMFNNFMGIVFFSAVYICLLKFARWVGKEDEDSDDATTIKVIGTLLYILVLIMFIVGIVNRLLNPDYHAIKILLRLFTLE